MTAEKDAMEYLIVGVTKQKEGCMEEAVHCAQEISEISSGLNVATAHMLLPFWPPPPPQLSFECPPFGSWCQDDSEII